MKLYLNVAIEIGLKYLKIDFKFLYYFTFRLVFPVVTCYDSFGGLIIISITCYSLGISI